MRASRLFSIDVSCILLVAAGWLNLAAGATIRRSQPSNSNFVLCRPGVALVFDIFLKIDVYINKNRLGVFPQRLRIARDGLRQINHPYPRLLPSGPGCGATGGNIDLISHQALARERPIKRNRERNAGTEDATQSCPGRQVR
jgi:hypothetical protein